VHTEAKGFRHTETEQGSTQILRRDDDMMEKNRQLFAGALCDVDSITKGPLPATNERGVSRVRHGGMHGSMIVSALMLLNADATTI